MIPRVVFLNPWDRLIGPNRYLLEMLRNLPDLARSATVVFDTANDAPEEYQQIECSTQLWPEVSPIHPRLSAGNALRLVKTHTAGLARVVNRLRSLKPDVVISNTENLWIGGMASRILGVPHLQVFHATTFKDRLSDHPWLVRAYLKVLSSLNRQFIGVSGAVTSALIESGVEHAQILRIPNPIDTNPYNIGNNALGLGDVNQSGRRDTVRYGNPVIICAGRISQMKGQDLLIRALPEVRKEFPGVKCLFAGRLGSDLGLDDTAKFYRDLLNQVASLGLESNVEFLGEVEGLSSLLGKADVYVQPSRTESFGRVVCESLLAGVPVAAFDVGGISEAAGPGGLLVPPADVPALSQAIIRIVKNHDMGRELAAAGRAHVRRNFEAADVAQSFFKLIIDASPARQYQERPAWIQS